MIKLRDDRCRTLRKISVPVAALFIMMTGCDDGRIYDEDNGSGERSGLTVRFSADLTGTSEHASGYTVALAGFTADGEYAEISKNLTDGAQDVTLAGVPAEVERVEVCLLNSIRKRIVTFAAVDVAPGEEIISFDAGSLEVSDFDAIQEGIFTPSCERCHGAGGHAAAGLSLLLGQSREALVGVESAVMPGKMRVSPGNPEESTLWLAVGSGESDDWAFSHRELLTPDRRDLILSWISR
ncbi:MAG: hypothetical protein K2O78_01500 [Muribaculaceae bacterium]|nr:hypothetical protein [Muribaculaceae bacterium]